MGARILSKVLCLSFLLLTSACGNIGELAQGYLYPAEDVNTVAIPDQPPAGYGQAMLDVPHTNGAMKIHLWYRPHPTNANAPLVIHFHGNGENLQRLTQSGFLKKAELLESNFVVFDYPSYGKSTGHPEQSTLMAAAQATLAWSKQRFPSSSLVLWGWSLGSAVAFQTAHVNAGSVRALIADSGWTTIREMATDKFGSLASQIPEELYQKNEWNTLAVAPLIGVPLLMHHGTVDDMVPFKFGERVSLAANPKLVRFVVMEGKSHGDIFQEASYWNDLIRIVKAAR